MLDQDLHSGQGFATLVDADSGVREESCFLESSRGAIFGVTYVPPQPRGAVLICSPILGEFLVNYRREVVLARSLARAGVAVQRFHYLGTGHSSGDEGALTLESMIEDAGTALKRLRERVQTGSVGFLGTRWGALIAASCAAGTKGAPLVFWQPVVQAERFAREAIRARVMRRLRKHQGTKTSEQAEVAELLDKGWLDVLGYRLDRRLYASGLGRSLQELLTDATGPALVLDFGRRAEPALEYRRLAEEMRARGLELAARNVPDEAPVWFSAHPSQGKTPAIDVTTTWLLAAFTRETAS